MKTFKQHINEARTKPMSTNFSLDTKSTISYAPRKIQKDVRAIFKSIPEDGLVFADSNWNKGVTRSWQIKTSANNIAAIIKKFPGGKKTNSGYTLNVGGYTLAFKISSKKSAGAGGGSDAKTTRMQELGSAWIMRRAINDKMRYKRWDDIPKDPKFHELVKIYPAIVDDTNWLKGYFAQQKKMLDEFSGMKFTEYNREGGFMDFISKVVKTKFGITKKDTWNPADIWLIKGSLFSIEKEIVKTVSGSSGSQTIQELNAVLRKMFKERRVVGISLKKISGQVAKYEEFNIDETDLGVNYNYDVTGYSLDLSFKGKGFGTQDSRIIVKGEGTEYNFQIKGNDSTKLSNLKFEPTAKGASAARVGKAPVDMVSALLSDNGVDFKNNNKNYPKTAEEFIKRKGEFIKYYEAVNKVAGTKTNGIDDFLDNMINGFNSSAGHIAVSKLMQLHFMYSVLKMPKAKRNEFMTDMVFIAAKKGNKFGPFGKLY